MKTTRIQTLKRKAPATDDKYAQVLRFIISARMVVERGKIKKTAVTIVQAHYQPQGTPDARKEQAAKLLNKSIFCYAVDKKGEPVKHQPFRCPCY